MKVTVETSLEDLFNAFIADELWAALNYKNAAFVSKGKALKFSNGIFEDNSDEEFEHMEELVSMAQSLGLKVKVNPKDAEKNCTTPYVDLSSDEDTKALVKLFIKSEKAAIEGYQTALKNENVLEKPELCQFFGEICNDEHNHLKELFDLASNVGVKTDDGEKTVGDGDGEASEKAENDENGDDSEDDTAKSILKMGSPLTGAQSDDEDEGEKEEKEEKKDKDDDSDEKDGKKDDDSDDSDEDEEEDEEDDEDSDEDDDDSDEDEDDEKKTVQESTIPFCKNTHSVSKMMSRAFKSVSKKQKKSKKR